MMNVPYTRKFLCHFIFVKFVVGLLLLLLLLLLFVVIIHRFTCVKFFFFVDLQKYNDVKISQYTVAFVAIE